MQPTFKIVVQGGADITQLIADRLIHLEVVDRAGVKSDTVSIEIDDRDQRLEIPKTGAKLEVSVGYVGGRLVKLGTYAVDEVSVHGPLRSMSIRGNAADMNSGIKGPKERSFHGKTFGEIVQTVAGDNNLKASISTKLSGRKIEHVDQTESDMQLLSRLCAENGATMKVSDGNLIIAEHASGKTNSGKTLPKVTISAGDCGNWDAVLAKRNNYQSVVAHYQDVKGAKRQKVTSGEGKPVLTLKHSYTNKEEAQSAADSKLQSMRRGGGVVNVQGHIGDPTLAAESQATLDGFRTGIDGDGWIVNQVTHSISVSGYTNSIELEAK
jgi:hypothetical protein